MAQESTAQHMHVHSLLGPSNRKGAGNEEGAGSKTIQQLGLSSEYQQRLSAPLFV